MKIVAVSQRVDNYPDLNETRDSLDQRLTTFLLAAGFMPVPVSNRLCNISSNKQYDYGALHSWLISVKPQAFVISGGNDIGEYIERDITEIYLLNHAEERKIPLLGICRGMQMMAHWAGTELRRINGHVRTRHTISGEIFGEVNSYHHFTLSACPAEFKILARSEDGEIEAISHDTLPWEGWMWHPERESKFNSRDLNRLRGLFS